jgi:hypothetical protein
VNGIEDETYTSIMGCKNYEELETLADQIQLPDIPRKTTTSHKRTHSIDKLSLSLVPDDNDLHNDVFHYRPLLGFLFTRLLVFS